MVTVNALAGSDAPKISAAPEIPSAFLMIFFFVIPVAIGGFGNWLLPLIMNVADIAFPRLNNLRFWLVPVSLLFMSLSLLVGLGPGTG